MTDLRDRVIEAMAHALWNERFPSDNWTEKAEAALDAALDVLGAYAESGHWLASIGDVIAEVGKGDSPDG